MLPYTILLIVIWTAFFIAWWALGIPLGPGAPASPLGTGRSP